MESEQRIQFEEKLLPIMCCLKCHSEDLKLSQKFASFNLQFPLNKENILCLKCGYVYPITEDFIPILWTPSLRSYLEGHESEMSNIGANINVYDNISDKYFSYQRQNIKIANRIKSAVRRMTGLSDLPPRKLSSLKYHLDFGCGPGHVLVWLKEYGFTQIGLDASIKNLRNARKNSGALVVCGDATNMPFKDDIFDLITESSVLHHIDDWKSTIAESCRVCNENASIILDSEPSTEQLEWSRPARAVYELRFPAYKILSLLWKEKHIFRNTKLAKINLLAEIHNQPGKGISKDELRSLFKSLNFDVDIIDSPDPELNPKANPNWQKITLNLLSARNPWNPKYGSFIALARPERKTR